MIEKTLIEVNINDLYEGDVIWIASVAMYAVVKFSDEAGFHAVLFVSDSDDDKSLRDALSGANVSMAYGLTGDRMYEKLIVEDV